MGNALTRRQRQKSISSPGKTKSSPTKSSTTNFGKDPALNRADFIVSKQTDATVVKRPGQINGQQFLIEDCTRCNVFVLDHCTSVQIDECHDCTIFIGPCTASLFVRNCSRTTLVCIVQQFRTRDCTDMDIGLFSSTAPIIESSKSLRVSCSRVSYMGLQRQLDISKFSVWTNKWSEVFDFTPAPGNWVPQATSRALLGKLPADVATELGFVESNEIIPFTVGLPSRVLDQVAFICVTTGMSEVAMQVASALASSGELQLIQTRQFRITIAQAKQLFGKDDATRTKVATESPVGVIVMEWTAKDATALQTLLTNECIKTHANALFVDIAHAPSFVELCWNEWKEVI
ncbi:hypothetical protein AeMF1_018699 [Aphanomyces euteiches]|nr:hypothetical protein AeMF1_018699 [Aphanomyces euteiches]KAH9192929.1 hypothetical protein AeNC1_005100 [Aphanomyces euteiches]